MRKLAKAVRFFRRQISFTAELTRYISFVHSYIGRYWIGYSVLFAVMLFGVFLSLFYASFLKDLMDAAVGHRYHMVVIILCVGLAMYGLNSLAGFLDTYYTSVIINSVKRDMKSNLFSHIVGLPVKFLLTHHTGDLLSRLQNDVDQVVNVAVNSTLNLLSIPLTFTAAFIYVLRISPDLAFITIAFGPVALGVSVGFRVYLRQNGQRIQEELGKIYTFASDALGGLTILRAFSLEKMFSARFLEKSQTLLGLETKGSVLSGSFNAAARFVGAVGFLTSVGFGALHVAKGTLSVGEFLAYISLVGHLMDPFTGAAGHLGGLQRSIAAAERIWQVLDERTELQPDGKFLPGKEPFRERPAKEFSSDKSIVNPRGGHSAIRFDNVSFSYDGRHLALSEINLDIRPDSVVAVVGPSGAGKSTFLHLMLNFYEPTSGKIFVYGKNCNEIATADMRLEMAYVPQDVYIFSGTIHENLLYGRPEASWSDVIAAARNANIHEFIESLPEGYETQVGERGLRLSGGEKQRIAIARAFLKDAPILLLDEATSSLDTESEKLVKQGLNRLMNHRTTVIVAHRLSTVQNADLIVVLEKGRVVEKGSHETLLAQQGVYSKLYHLQFTHDEKIEAWGQGLVL